MILTWLMLRATLTVIFNFGDFEIHSKNRTYYIVLHRCLTLDKLTHFFPGFDTDTRPKASSAYMRITVCT